MKIRFFFFLLTLLIANLVYSQSKQKSNHLHFLFYNVENLFDTYNDPEINDEEFVPDGARSWSYHKYHKKLLDISKIILQSSGWQPPALIGLCEVENRRVLEDLLSRTPLNKLNYKIIHKESPDHRGIDVALLYNSDLFDPISYDLFPLLNKKEEVIPSREILYVKGILQGIDTIHLYVNHWPSRYGGLLETEPGRIRAARQLLDKIEGLYESHKNPKIIVTGDLNDQPLNVSVANYLKAKPVDDQIKGGNLYNLSHQWQKSGTGTIKYRSGWFVFDQFIVSGSLLSGNAGYTTCAKCARIVQPDILLEKDLRYGGMKPFRTFNGYKYNGGFSDHLPIVLRLTLAGY